METTHKFFDEEYKKLIKEITEVYYFYKQNYSFFTKEEIKSEILKITKARIEDLIEIDNLIENFKL